SAKLPQVQSVGGAKPVPPSCSGVFSAVTMVKYSGTSTVSERTTSSAVSHQLTPPAGRCLRRARRARRVLGGGRVTASADIRPPPPHGAGHAAGRRRRR